MRNLKWSEGNSKVSKLDAVSFGIPAFKSADGFKTCPKAGACAAVCYARQGFYTMDNVQATREHNLAKARGDLREFVRMAVEDLQTMTYKLVRIHDSGDFFSQDYLSAWVEIAKRNPGKTFYAYTKSLHLDYSALPSNFKLVQSEGGLMDASIDKTRPHSRIFRSDYARRQAGYGHGSNTDTLAIRGEVKIGLIYHGQKKLSDAQAEYFS